MLIIWFTYCKYLRLSDISEKIFAQFSRCHAAAGGVIGKLTAVDLTHAEIFCPWVREHQSRHGGVGLHHAVFGEPHAYLREGQKAVDEENDALVG